MSQKPSESEEDDIPEMELSGGVRGKYYEAYQKGTNVVLLEPDGKLGGRIWKINLTLLGSSTVVDRKLGSCLENEPTGRKPSQTIRQLS